MNAKVWNAMQLAMLCTMFGVDLGRLQREHEQRRAFRRAAWRWLKGTR